jgi:regulator of cell morphogenesis and NO signaling
MKITDALKGEHGVFYAQFDHLERLVPSANLPIIQALGALLAAGLAPHAHIENEILFPALESQLGGEGGPLTAFREEHAEIEGTLTHLQELRALTQAHDDIEGALQRLPQVDDVEEARQMVRHVLLTAREHFLKEEQMLFPMAEDILSERQLERLCAAWAERRGVRWTMT